MSDCNEIVCCPEVMSSYVAGGGDVPQEGVLLNVDFTPTNPSDKSGFAATGLTQMDFWNAFVLAQAQTAMALKWSDGSDSPVTIQSTGASGGVMGNNGNTDKMVASFLENSGSGHEKTFTLAGLETGTYDLYLYGYSNQSGSLGPIGQFLVLINGVQYPTNLSFYFCNSNPSPPPWVNGQNFVRLAGIPITAGQLLQIKAFYEGTNRYGKISGLQLVKSPPTPDATSIVEPNITNGAAVYFFGGASQVGGGYRVTNLNGACRYGPEHGFSVNFDGATNGYIINHSGGTEITGPWTIDLPTQAEVEAVMMGTYVDFPHTGGPIFMYLRDTLYGDNIAGSPNPRFVLSRLS